MVVWTTLGGLRGGVFVGAVWVGWAFLLLGKSGAICALFLKRFLATDERGWTWPGVAGAKEAFSQRRKGTEEDGEAAFEPLIDLMNPDSKGRFEIFAPRKEADG